MVKFNFLPEIAPNGVAFEAFGKMERELLQNCATVLSEAMVDTKTIRRRESQPLNIRRTSFTDLLFYFLEHLIFLKNAKQFLIKNVKVGFEKQGKSFTLQGFAYGEKLDENRHKLRSDIRGVSKDLFDVEKGKSGGLRAQVILEI